MAKSESYSAYEQVAHPEEGARQQAGKSSANCDDALGRPGSIPRQAVTTAKERPDSDQTELIECQLGSNGYQSNGYHPRMANEPVARRGFGDTPAAKGDYQGR